MQPADAPRSHCTTCQLDDEGREARCGACPCLERAALFADRERTHQVLADAAATLCLGIDGTITRERAYDDAFVALYSHLYGQDEAILVLAEGRRHG